MLLVFRILVWITITTNFICTITGFIAWKQLKKRSLMWFSILLAGNLIINIVSMVMNHLRINNHEFMNYSNAICNAALLIFALYILNNKKFRIYSYVAYSISLVIFFILELLHWPIAVKELIMPTNIFYVFIGIVIYRDRLPLQINSALQNDPWTLIAIILLATKSISLVATICSFFSSNKPSLHHISFLLVYLNCLAFLICYLLITIQLKKLKTHTLS
jgi:hypothetical protein